MLVLGLWGLDRGGVWRDEAVTLQVARRSAPEIWRLLHGVDAVHGLYYLLMHAVLAVRPGTAAETALRLPSVVGAAATAGLVAALGVRLAWPRVGLWAGLLYAATPLAGHYAQEGRSYALVAAGATGATLQLVRALTGRPWWPYGVLVALTCLLHELAVLLVLAHALTLALARVPGRVWARWTGAAGAAVLALVPLALASQAQAAQVAWLPRPGPGSAERLLHAFLGVSGLVFWTCLLLAAVALLPDARRRSLPALPALPTFTSVPALAAVALPLATVPPLTLLAVSQVRPMYDDRYVLYALAGAPLLVAAGADRLLRAGARLVPRRGAPAPGPRAALTKPLTRRLTRPLASALAGTVAVALAFFCQLPLHRQDRTLLTRPDGLAAVSEAAARAVRPGEAVVFLPSIGRRAAVTYPAGFRGVRDVALRASGPASGTLYGREIRAGELRRRLRALDRLWVVAEPYALRSPWYPRNPTERVKLTVVEEEFAPSVPSREFVRDGVTLRLYSRRPPTDPPARSPAHPRMRLPAPPPLPPRPAPR
ncbi:glycosyltransferase family 39 protein [Streptomyces sp. NBC_01275]|nr:glycosyltransferase family 39 protein [Streptomyces sp. NBC_01275]